MLLANLAFAALSIAGALLAAFINLSYYFNYYRVDGVDVTQEME